MFLRFPRRITLPGHFITCACCPFLSPLQSTSSSSSIRFVRMKMKIKVTMLGWHQLNYAADRRIRILNRFLRVCERPQLPRNQPPKIPARRKRSVRRQNKRSQPNRDHNWLTRLCSRAVLFIRDAFNWRHQLTSTWASGCFQNCYRYISHHNLVLSTLFFFFFSIINIEV